jgi:Nuclease-related domain
LKVRPISADVRIVESESLPFIGSAPTYDRRYGGLADAGYAAHPVAVDDAALERVERRLIKALRGTGAIVLHDLVVPATGTTIDHLCISPTGITAIDVERDSEGGGRSGLVERVRRESQVVAAALTDALVEPDQVTAAVCRATRPEPRRSASVGSVVIGGPRAVARAARRIRPGGEIDVQLALAVARSHLGYENQRAHRVTKPDGYLTFAIQA